MYNNNSKIVAMELYKNHNNGLYVHFLRYYPNKVKWHTYIVVSEDRLKFIQWVINNHKHFDLHFSSTYIESNVFSVIYKKG